MRFLTIQTHSRKKKVPIHLFKKIKIIRDDKAPPSFTIDSNLSITATYIFEKLFYISQLFFLLLL